MKSTQIFPFMLVVGLLTVSVVTFVGLSSDSHQTQSHAQVVLKGSPTSVYYTYSKGEFAHCTRGTEYNVYGSVVYKGQGLALPIPVGYNAYRPVILSFIRNLNYLTTTSTGYLVVWTGPTSQLRNTSAILSAGIYTIECVSDGNLISLQ